MDIFKDSIDLTEEEEKAYNNVLYSIFKKTGKNFFDNDYEKMKEENKALRMKLIDIMKENYINRCKYCVHNKANLNELVECTKASNYTGIDCGVDFELNLKVD